MATDRSFYGGEAPGGHTTGEVGGPRQYAGSGLGDAPWTCPACRVQQTSPFEDGCPTCGAGTQKPFKREQPQGQPHDLRGPDPQREARLHGLLRSDMQRSMDLYQYALQWSAANPEATLADAFVAGYQYANAKTLGAPPVTVDVPRLAPEGKPRRTILAALTHFREQVLPHALEEVASGEWCSDAEIAQIIATLTAEDDEGAETA